MVRTLVLSVFLWTLFAGPLIGIAATSLDKRFDRQQSKSLCYVAGIACGSGAMLLPAMARFK